MPAKNRRRKAPHPPVVFVEWHDSRSVSGAWKDRNELLDEVRDKLWSEVIVSAGLLLEANKHYIVLSAGLAPIDDVLHTFFIPRSNVVRITVLKRARGMKLVKAPKRVK